MIPRKSKHACNGKKCDAENRKFPLKASAGAVGGQHHRGPPCGARLGRAARSPLPPPTRTATPLPPAQPILPAKQTSGQRLEAPLPRLLPPFHTQRRLLPLSLLPFPCSPPPPPPPPLQAEFNAKDMMEYSALVRQQALAAGGTTVQVAIKGVEDRPSTLSLRGINILTEVRFPGPVCQQSAAAAFAFFLNMNQAWIKEVYGPSAAVIDVELGCAPQLALTAGSVAATLAYALLGLAGSASGVAETAAASRACMCARQAGGRSRLTCLALLPRLAICRPVEDDDDYDATEAARKKAEEEAAKKKAELEAAAKKQAEEAAKKVRQWVAHVPGNDCQPLHLGLPAQLHQRPQGWPAPAQQWCCRRLPGDCLLALCRAAAGRTGEEGSRGCRGGSCCKEEGRGRGGEEGSRGRCRRGQESGRGGCRRRQEGCRRGRGCQEGCQGRRCQEG